MSYPAPPDDIITPREIPFEKLSWDNHGGLIIEPQDQV